MAVENILRRFKGKKRCEGMIGVRGEVVGCSSVDFIFVFAGMSLLEGNWRHHDIPHLILRYGNVVLEKC